MIDNFETYKNRIKEFKFISNNNYYNLKENIQNLRCLCEEIIKPKSFRSKIKNWLFSPIGTLDHLRFD